MLIQYLSDRCAGKLQFESEVDIMAITNNCRDFVLFGGI